MAAILFDCFAQGHVQPWAMEVKPGLEGDRCDIHYDVSIEDGHIDDTKNRRQGLSHSVNS